MNKFLPLVIIANLFYTSVTIARTHSIIEKDIYGSGLYSSGVINGNYLYVNMSESRLDVLDLTDNNNVTLFNNLEVPCTVFDLAIDGDILAAGCSHDIHFYDVSNAANPISIGSFDNGSEWVNEFVFEGNRLYLANEYSEIIVYDTSDTSNLIELSKVTLNSYSSIKLHKNGNFLYTVESFDVVGIYDVSDANDIILSSEYQDPSHQFFDVAVVSNTLYLAHADGIQAVDIVEPSSPVFINDFTPSPDTGVFGRSNSLYTNGNDLFMGTNKGEVIQYDLSDPHSPIDLTFYSLSSYQISDLMLFESNILTFSEHGGLSMADFSDTNNIIPLNGYNHSSSPQNIAIENNRVITTNDGGGYHLLELNDQVEFIEVNRIEDIQARGEVALSGDTAWLGGYSSVETYDISNYSSPINIDSVEIDSNWANLVTVYDGNYLFVGNFNGEIFIYDLANNIPVLASTISFGLDSDTDGRRTIEDFKRYGDYLLVATRYDDLVVIDLSDIGNPIELANYSWSTGNNPQIEVVGNTLYLSKSSGLSLADLTDINNPVYLGSRGSYGVLHAIDVVEESNGVLLSGNALYYLDSTEENNPVEVHSVESEDLLTSMAYHNGTIVAASSTKSRLKSYQLNSAPVSTDSAVIANVNSVYNGQLNSVDLEGDNITFTVDVNVTNGTLVISNDGSFEYAPNDNFVGSDTFQYIAEDEHGGISSASVSITVESGYDHVFDAKVNTMLFGEVSETGLDGDKFKFKMSISPTNGKILFKKDGTFKYIAKPDFVGEDTFEYVASNGTEISEAKTVKINVNSAE